MKKTNKLIQIHPSDNVAVCVEDIEAGERIETGDYEITALEAVGKGHKLSLSNISEGQEVIKYGNTIGHGIKNIKPGEFVHTHNLKTGLKGQLEYSYHPGKLKMDIDNSMEFMGFQRENGEVGVRNEVWIVNTVGCINKTSEILAKLANQRYEGKTDGIFAFPHPYGCSQLGEDQFTTQKILADMVNHPNAGAVLVLGLGCENNNINEFKKVLGQYLPDRVKFLSTQEVEDELEEGVKLLGELVAYAGKFKRQACPVSKLIIGLKCGGSDAFSGITANPLVGAFSDRFIEQGGTSILTEVPEMFGAETILMDRCRNKEIFNKTVNLINDFKDYYLMHNQVVYENPSPGNKKGGITTLEEKSLGCIQKGGTGTVVDVLAYGERVKAKGLNLLSGPGNDIVASTALMASGAQLILFTTGRGTPLGAPVPTIKISSNTALSIKKSGWIDFNAGAFIDDLDTQKVEKDFFQFVIKVAAGEIKTKNEIQGYREIAIFKDGVTL